MKAAPLTPAANPRKTTSVRPLAKVDISALRAAVLATPEEVWNAENAAKPNRFEVLDATRHIVFRFIDSPRDWRSSHDRPAWALWREVLEPVLAEPSKTSATRAASGVSCWRAWPPGGVIHPHIDAIRQQKWPHKIHVPLITNDQVICFFGDRERHFPAGEAIEVNNLGPHWVRNNGDTDRIHLIFEYYDADQPAPDWLEPFLMSGETR